MSNNFSTYAIFIYTPPETKSEIYYHEIDKESLIQDPEQQLLMKHELVQLLDKYSIEDIVLTALETLKEDKKISQA